MNMYNKQILVHGMVSLIDRLHTDYCKLWIIVSVTFREIDPTKLRGMIAQKFLVWVKFTVLYIILMATFWFTMKLK